MINETTIPGLGEKKINVLLVDDNNEFLVMEKLFLERKESRLNISSENSAKNALEHIEENRIDIIVSDYKMPEMDGLDFLRELREERNNDIPFIMLTGQGREEVAISALNLGADRYLQKGGGPTAQFGVLAQAIIQEVTHDRTEKQLELTTHSVEKASLCIFWMDPDGRFVYVNDAVVEKFGYTKEEFMHMHVWDIDPYYSEDRREIFWNRLKKKGDLNIETIQRTKDGKEFYVEVNTNYIKYKGRELEFAFAEDITDRKEYELQIEHLNSLLMSIRDINQLIVQGDDLYKTVEGACDILLETQGYLNIVIALLDDDVIRPVINLGQHGKREWSIKQNGEGDAMRCIKDTIKSGETNIIEDPEQYCQGCRYMEEDFFHKTVIVPIIQKGNILGIISTCIIPGQNISDTEIGLLEEVAGDLGFAMEKIKAEEALHENEEKYRTIFESAKDAILIMDDDKFIDCNEKTLELFECAQEDILNNSPYRFSPEKQPDGRDSKEKALDIINSALEGEPQIFEWVHTTLDGEQFLAEVSLNKYTIDDEDLVMSIVRDISERKRVEEALRKSEERLDHAMAVKNEGYWDWDLVTNQTYFDDRYYTMVGYEPGEFPMTFSAWEKRVHPLDLEESKSDIEAYLNGKSEKFDVEFRFKHKDGSWKWIRGRGKVVERDEDGSPLRFIGTHTDITERKRAEEEVKYRENLDSIITDISTSLINIDLEEIDDYIEKALEKIGEFTDADRSYIFLFYDDLKKMDNAYEWCAEDVKSQKDVLQDMSTDDFPWVMEKLKAFDNITIPKVSDLPPEAEAEKEHFCDQNIGSLLAVPMVSNRCLKGFIGYDDVENEVFSNEIIDLMQVIGTVIASALDRMDSMRKLHESEKHLSATLQSIGDGVIATDKQGMITNMNPVAEKLCGWTLDEAFEKPLSEVFHIVNAKTREKVDNPVKRVLTSGNVLGLSNHTLLISKDGTEYQIADSAAPIRDTDGETSGVVMVFRDVTEEYQRNKEIIYQQKLLEGVLNNITDVVGIQKPDHTVERYNQTGYDLLEMTPDEVKGKKCYELIGRTRECEECATRKALKSGEMEKLEKYFPELGLYFDCRINPILDDDGNIVRVVEHLRDITERRRTEEALRESEKRYRSVITVSNTGAWEFNRKSNYLWCSPEYFEMLGRDPEDYEMDGKSNLEETWISLLHPDDRERAVEKFSNYLEEGSVGMYENHFRMRHADGSWVWIWSRGQTLRNSDRSVSDITVGTHIDITDRKQAESALEESKNRIKRLNEIGAKIQLCDSEEEVYSLAVKAAEDILDFDICSFDVVKGDMFMTKKISTGTPADGHTERRLEEGGLDSKTYLNKESYLVEDVFADKDAKPVKSDYRSAISLPIGDHGVFQAVSREVGHFDEEDLKTAELMINHVSQALYRIRVKGREDFLHSLLRHDIRNKIQVIQGYIQLLEEEIEDERSVEMIHKAITATRYASNLIKKVRTLRELIAEHEIEHVDIYSILETVISNYQERMIEEDIEVEYEKIEATVHGGPLLKEVFSNMLENVIKHAECDKIKVSSKDEKHELIVNIEEDGIGVPDDIKEKIFERGYKSKETGGSGLGLYLVKEILTGYGGSIEVKDSYMGGAKFELRFEKVKPCRSWKVD